MEGSTKVKTLITSLALIGALALPAAAGADTTQADQKNAAKECKALRAASGEQNFRTMFGGGKNAYGKCVSQRARENAKERQAAHTNASKACKAERDADRQAFGQKYKNLGQCVSQKVREEQAQERQADQAEQNAAKKCKTQRTNDAAGFAQQWGTRRNAFGKCVSATARASQQS
jgi:hypothetical protein